MTSHVVRRLRRMSGLAVVAGLLFVGPVLADDTVRAAAAVADADIQSDVVDAVLGYVHYGVLDSVDVSSGGQVFEASIVSNCTNP